MNSFKFLTKKAKSIFASLSLSILIFINNLYITTFATNEINTGAQFKQSYNQLSKFMQTVGNGMLGIAILSGIGTTIYHSVRLASVGSNPNARSKVIQDLLTTLFCIALLGSVGFVMNILTLFITVKVK